jgi:hypothetical protein
MTIKQQITEYINKIGVGEAAKQFGTNNKRIHAWLDPESPVVPDIDDVEKFLELKGINFESSKNVDGTENVKATEYKDPANPDLAICIPTARTVSSWVLFSHIILARDLPRDKALYQVEIDSLIVNARNRLADWFINKTNASWSLWFDDDILFPLGRPDFFLKFANITEQENINDKLIPEHVLYTHIVDRLMSHNQPIVGGTYFGRHAKGVPLNGEGMRSRDAYQTMREARGHLIETDWTGTGVVLIHRDVFKAIQAKFPERQPQDGSFPYFDYFRPPVASGQGEDVEFFKLAGQAGFKTLVDTGALCLHFGMNAWGPHNTKNQLAGV